MDPTSSSGTVVFRLLAAVVLLAPLPFGAQRPWAWSLMAAAVGLLLVAWGTLVAAGVTRQPVPLRRLAPAAVPFLLVLAWAVLQGVPGLSPLPAHPMWQEALQELARPGGAAVSADPAMTRDATLRLAAYGGIFFLAVQLGRDRARAREGLVAFAVAGVLYAAYGLAVHFSGAGTVLWYDKWAYVDDLTATFVNRNSYAAYAGLGLLACLGLFIIALPTQATGRRRAHDLAEAVLLRAAPFLAGALILGTALMLSHSRGALLATGAGLMVLIAALAGARVVRARQAFLLAVFLAAGVLMLLSGSGAVTVERFTEVTTDDAGRLLLARLTLDAIRDAPWTGSGLGAFEQAFSLYRDVSLGEPVAWDFAHNVHLELAMDLGVPAALLLYASFGAILAACILALGRRRRDQVYPAVALAAAATLGLHGLVDFSVQIPAVAASLAFLLGLGYAQSWSHEGKS